jgi:hypothetical protein
MKNVSGLLSPPCETQQKGNSSGILASGVIPGRRKASINRVQPESPGFSRDFQQPPRALRSTSTSAMMTSKVDRPVLA